MSKSWREAVWEALQRQSRKHAAITRQQLIDDELETISKSVGSTGATPTQTLSRILQELRDDGVLIFDGQGRYRLTSGAVERDVETAVATEAMRLQASRIGQGAFRRKLEDRWQSACPMTGIADRALLRASHVVPWNRCESAAERLSVDNGLLLSALWDAAFDNGLVAFDDDGTTMFAARIETQAERALRQAQRLTLPFLNVALQTQLAKHRALHATRALRRAT